MVDALSKSQSGGVQQQQPNLNSALDPSLLIKATQTAPQTTVATPVPREIVRDLKGFLQIAQKEKAISASDARVIKEHISHAEKTGTLDFGVNAETLRNYKSILSQAIRQSAANRRGPTKPYESHEKNLYKRHNVFKTVYPPSHPLSQVRREMFAMILGNKQLAGIIDPSMKQKGKDLGLGQDFSSEQSVDEVLAERLRSALDLQTKKKEEANLQDRATEDPSADFFKVDADTTYASALRSEIHFGFLDESDGLEVLLDGVVDMMPYIAAKRAQETGRNPDEVAAEVFQFQEFVQKRRKGKKGGIVTEEDCETLLLIQYLPILYDAVNYIMDKDLPPESVARMESLKGELASLIQAASDPESAINKLFKEIKDSLQDREMVEWTG